MTRSTFRSNESRGGRAPGPADGSPARRVTEGAGTGDDALVRAAQAGDVDAFGHLYERHFDAVYGYLCFRLRSTEEAEDVAGQVFLRALESLPRYRWTGVPFRAWLFRIARNLLVDALRRTARRPVAPLDDLLPDPGRLADPQDWLAERVRREALLRAVERLTAGQRHVVALRFAAGLSTAEVARILGRSQGAVKALQHAGLRALQRRLAGSAGR